MSRLGERRLTGMAASLRACALVWLWGLLGAAAALAAPFGVPDDTAEALVAKLQERYEVIELSRGYVVRPRDGARFELIEVEEQGVLVDGRRYDLDGLREIVGDDAEILYALAGDVAALETWVDLRREAEEQQRQAAQELEESIRRQAGELERLDRRRLEQIGQDLGRERRRRSRTVRSETRVSLFSSLTVEDNESARDVVVILGPLDVRGEVRGDSVVVLGSAEITGRLEGQLTVVGGNVSIGREAVIEGDVNCVGGAIHSAPGAEIEGEITEVSMAPFSVDLPGFDFEGWELDWPFGRRNHRGLELAGTVFNTALLAILILLTVGVARRRVSSVAERARTEPWKSGLIGFVVEVLIAPVVILISLLLVLSIVGIPVLVVLLPLTLLVILILFFLGYAGVAVAVGNSLRGRRSEVRRLSPYLAVLVGLVLIQSWHILGEGLAFAGGLVRLTGYLLILFGFFLKYLAWTVGLGAVMLDRFSPLPAAEPYSPEPPPELPAAGPADGDDDRDEEAFADDGGFDLDARGRDET